MSDLIGRKIADYQITEFIGQGGMGAVFKATDESLDRDVALKLMHAHIASQKEFRDRLTEEARTIAKLDHPSIVKIYSFGQTDDNELYVAMEYVPDGSLRDHLIRIGNRGNRMDLSLGLQIVIQIAEALHHAHLNDVIHRDVKPGNIILKQLVRPEEGGFAPFRAILTDFGLVQVLNERRVTQTGVTMGTPVYMSPEQCEGKTLDHRSDLYSLGVVLFEILNGRPPFEFSSLSEAIATHIRGDGPPNIRDVRPNVPAIIDAILKRALAKNPNQRYENGAEMARALRTAYRSIADLPTRFFRTPVQIDDIELVEPPTGYELLITTEGRVESDRFQLDKPAITFGRGPDNDINLSSESVSRHHASLEYTAAGWTIRAMPGMNGTFLNRRRMRPDQPFLWAPGEPAQIGPYVLTLMKDGVIPPTPPTEELNLDTETVITPESAEPRPTRTQRFDPPVAGNPTPRTQDEPSTYYGMFLDRDTVPIDPGRSEDLVVEVLNRTHLDDRVRLQVEGIPTQWVSLPSGFTPVPAGERAAMTVQIRPPREYNTALGRERFRIILVSQNNPDISTAVSADLEMASFEAFNAEMNPEDPTLPGTITVTITNAGNQPAIFSVLARESEDLVKFTGERGRIRLGPGDTADVELELDWNRNPFFNNVGEDGIPYEIEVRSEAGGMQTLNGIAYSRSALRPIWASGCFLIPLLFLCGLMSVYALLNNNLLLGRAPTATPFVIVGPTSEIYTPPPLPSELTETVIVQTNTPEVDLTLADDLDDDGLSNYQENLLGSDPNVADTDGDGLLDGIEANLVGTNPVLADSDFDGLTDPQEFQTYNTDPGLDDTDGDGLLDGQEVAAGSNPLDANSPQVTQPTQVPTATPIPPATDTPAPTAIPPTDAPTMVPTDPPTDTPTEETTVVPTDVPTEMPTDAAPSETPLPVTPLPTKTETPTPTFTPEPTATETVIDTPASLPTLSCADNPPTVDGQIGIDEPWQLLTTFALASDQTRTVEVYTVKHSEDLYFAFNLNNAAALSADSLRIYIDAERNLGDPSFGDRFVQVVLDPNTPLQVLAGIGSETDGDLWDPNYTIINTDAQVMQTGFGWVVEVRINKQDEIPFLAPSFGLMVQSLYTDIGEEAFWPENANSNSADNWQQINLGNDCPIP